MNAAGEAGIPLFVQSDAIHTPLAQTGFTTLSESDSFLHRVMRTSTAQNDYVEFKVLLKKGTYEFELATGKANNLGIVTVKLNGSSVGTLDLYASATDNFIVLSLTGITVTRTDVYTMRLEMATKNASSSGYGGRYCGWQWRRTGA